MVKRRSHAQWPCFCVSACSCAPHRRHAAGWGASAASAKRPVCAGLQAAHLTCCPPAPEGWAHGSLVVGSGNYDVVAGQMLLTHMQKT